MSAHHGREWKKEYVLERNQMRYVAHCCKCGETTSFPAPMGTELASQRLSVKLKKLGWLVGKNTQYDLCPACVLHYSTRVAHKYGVSPTTCNTPFKNMSTALIAEAYDLAKGTEPMKSPENTLNGKGKGYIPVLPNETTPTEMSRTDKRVIFAKLEEVYADEATGYSKGWGDQKVATDLGVPVAWVAKVRDDNFGPNRSEETLATVTEARAILVEAKEARSKFVELIKVAEAQASKIGLHIERIERKIDALVKRV